MDWETGALDLVGADDAVDLMGIGDETGAYDLVGAAPRRRLAPAQRAAVQRAAIKSAQVQKMQRLALAGKLPQILLGMQSDAAIGAGLSADVTTEPQVPVRLTSCTIGASIAAFFSIGAFTIARMNLLATSGRVPAEMFLPNAELSPLETPILPAGSQIVMNVTNDDGAAHFFRAGFKALDLTPARARII
jgi:hypothetical protein